MDRTLTIWLEALASVVIISLCGLVPIICMPRLQRTRHQDVLLQFFIGLAIGTLTADALLHLLPSSKFGHSLDLDHHSNCSHDTHAHLSNGSLNLDTASNGSIQHDHGKHEHNHSLHHHDQTSFWFGFMALVGIIGFLILERIMVLLTDVFTHKEHRAAPTKSDVTETTEVCALPSDPHLHDHQNHHQHQHHHLNSKTQSFMFMIITGDGLHNFFDGIAIGVAYGNSWTVGLSTSIAILCHELPHEIGDFAVLIKSGMSIKRAVLYNMLSSILCFLGVTTGVFLDKNNVDWVSALIAGMFLYISLVDMVPQLDCYPAEPALVRAKMLLVQFLGIALGVAIMSLIAIYESSLHSAISN